MALTTFSAIGLVPNLSWAFLLIALLPSALFGRAMLSADASSLAYTMIVVALCLRGAYRMRDGGPWMRSLWITLCVLGKPPQIVFILSEALRGRINALAGNNWRRSAIAVLPALMLAIGWAVVSSGDAGAWRIVGGSSNALEHFQPLWKLRVHVRASMAFSHPAAGNGPLHRCLLAPAHRHPRLA